MGIGEYAKRHACIDELLQQMGRKHGDDIPIKQQDLARRRLKRRNILKDQRFLDDLDAQTRVVLDEDGSTVQKRLADHRRLAN